MAVARPDPAGMIPEAYRAWGLPAMTRAWRSRPAARTMEIIQPPARGASRRDRDKENEAPMRRLREGIELDETTWNQILRVADGLQMRTG